MSESVSFSTSYNKNEGDLDYSGSFDVSGLSLLSFYGGYKADKYNIWAVSSSGSGSATLTANVDGVSNAASSGVDYAMTALGGSYHINDLFDVGYEMVSSASLDFAGNEISTHSSNGASRSKIFGSIDFGKWTRASKPKAETTRRRGGSRRGTETKASNFSWAPSLTFASRSDSGDTSAGGSGSASGFETTIAVELEYGRVHFEFGNRNFSADSYSESGQWFTFHLVPSERGGLNVSFSQRTGAAGSRSNDLLSADYVASLSQELSNGQNNSLENKVISSSEISYGWSTSTGSVSLFTRAQGNASKMYSMNELFGSDSSFGFGTIGAKFDNKDKKFSLSAEIQGLNGGLGANSSSNSQGNVADDNQKFTLEGKLRF